MLAASLAFRRIAMADFKPEQPEQPKVKHRFLFIRVRQAWEAKAFNDVVVFEDDMTLSFDGGDRHGKAAYSFDESCGTGQWILEFTLQANMII